MSSPYTSNGTLRQEDIWACNIARSAIARSLVQEARKTTLLVTTLIGKITTRESTAMPIDDLWKQVQNNAELRAIKQQTDANVDDYSQFSGWVEGERKNIAYNQKTRLEGEIGNRIFEARFGNCKRLEKLHLVPAN